MGLVLGLGFGLGVPRRLELLTGVLEAMALMDKVGSVAGWSGWGLAFQAIDESLWSSGIWSMVCDVPKQKKICPRIPPVLAIIEGRSMVFGTSD